MRMFVAIGILAATLAVATSAKADWCDPADRCDAGGSGGNVTLVSGWNVVPGESLGSLYRATNCITGVWAWNAHTQEWSIVPRAQAGPDEEWPPVRPRHTDPLWVFCDAPADHWIRIHVD